MEVLSGGTDQDKLHNLCALNYKEQGIHFLNAFWSTFAEREAENVWKYVEICGTLDSQQHGDGVALEEVWAHRFIELIHETLTVMAMRDKLRKVGAIGQTERPKLVPLIHYLLYKYDCDWHILVNAKEGNAEEIAHAQALLDAALQRAEEARQAQAELDAALREVKLQEDAYNSKTEDLKRRSTTGGLVSQNKAKNELAQHLAEDPLPLRRAKITLEAAVRKAENAVRIAEKQYEDAEAYLAEVRTRTGSPKGRLWWMSKTLHESKKYLPASRGGIAKK